MTDNDCAAVEFIETSAIQHTMPINFFSSEINGVSVKRAAECFNLTHEAAEFEE